MRKGGSAVFWAACALIAALIPCVGAGAAAPAGWVTDRVRFEPLDAPLTVAGTGDYRGVLEVRGVGRALTVVNEVGLDDYVKGISEVPVRWPAEAQKAQAIAARTYALYQMAHRPKGAVADICPTQSCQVYVGMAKERREGAQAWSAAVDSTAGQVLVWRGGPINAKYSSTNGGRTVAGGQPYLRSVEDRDDAVSPYSHWQVALPLATLAGLFTPPGELRSVSRIGESVALHWAGTAAAPTTTTSTTAATTTTTIEPTRFGPTATDTTAEPMREEPTTGQLLVPVADFRARVNAAMPAPAGLPLTLPSTRFTLTSDGASAIADGRGWGHGIGMSQYGALGKALRGMRAPEILAAYYAGLKPVTLPPQQLPAAIRVQLDEGRANTTISGAKFRVVDGAGNIIALVAGGNWQVVPAGTGRVRVVPPADQVGPPAVTGARLDRPSPYLGQPSRLRFALGAPAAVRVTWQLPGQPEAAQDLGPQASGPHVVDLPASAASGPGHLVIQADAGGGRITTLPVAFTVVAPPPPHKPARLAAVDHLVPSASLDAWLRALATALLAAASALLVRTRRQLH